MLRVYLKGRSIGLIKVHDGTKIVDIAYFTKIFIESLNFHNNVFIASFNFYETPSFGTPEMNHLEHACIPHPINVDVPVDLYDNKYLKYTIGKAREMSKQEFLITGLNHIDELKEIRVDIVRPEGLSKYEYELSIPESYYAIYCDKIIQDFTAN